MNFEERYVCPSHPDTTIGADPGQTEPPTCKRFMCGRAMELIEKADSRVQHVQDDPRRQPPGRPESKPL